MTQNIWCRFFNMHKYEIIKEEPVLSRYGDRIIAINVVSRCSNCGKIKQVLITKADEYRQ